jgi:hypothetical protein
LMAWHVPEYNGIWSQTRRRSARTPTTAGTTASVSPAAAGSGFSFTTSYMTRSAMSRIGTWFPPLSCAPCRCPPGTSVEAVQKIFEPRRRRSSGSVVLAKPVTVSTASSFAGS